MAERAGSTDARPAGRPGGGSGDRSRRRGVRRFRSLRARITLITTLVVAVSAGLGGAGFAFVLSQSLLDQATTAAELELDRFEAAVDTGGPTALTELDGHAQLLRDGVVVGATDDLDDAPPLAGSAPADASPADSAPADSAPDAGDDDSRDGDDDSGDDSGRDSATVDTGELTGRVVTVPGDDDRLVLAATDTDDGLLIAGVDDGPRAEAVGTTVALLLGAVPLLVAAMALVTWLAVGRALRPVERIRHDTEQVTAADLGRRIATPGSGDEIDRLAQTMNRMLERLDESQRRQRRFVSDASHELRSPISALRQNAEVALAYPDRLPAERLGHTVAEESERLAALVDGLLLLTRADEKGLVPDARDVDLDDLALAEARRLRALAPGLTVDATGVSAARVQGDIRMLERALRNLGDNAARHARSRIALSCTVSGGTAVLAVDDDGPGIPDAERERVFERFVRLDDSRARDSGGSGLGLAIVASIAAAHGGAAAAAASPLGGARLELRLPAA